MMMKDYDESAEINTKPNWPYIRDQKQLMMSIETLKTIIQQRKETR